LKQFGPSLDQPSFPAAQPLRASRCYKGSSLIHMASVGGWSEGQQGLNPIALSTFRTRTRPVGTQKKKKVKKKKAALHEKSHISRFFF
jgi:hypothetical protein